MGSRQKLMSDGATLCTWKVRDHYTGHRVRRALSNSSQVGRGPRLLIKQQERSQSYFPTGRPDIRVSVPGAPLLPSPAMGTLRGLKGVIISSEILPRGHLPFSRLL